MSELKQPKKKVKPSQKIIHGILSERVNEYFDSEAFDKDMAQLEPRDRLSIMEKFAQYIVPKQQSQRIDMNTNMKVSKSFADQVKDLAAQYDSTPFLNKEEKHGADKH